MVVDPDERLDPPYENIMTTGEMDNLFASVWVKFFLKLILGAEAYGWIIDRLD